MRPNGPWPSPGPGFPVITCRRPPSSTTTLRCYPWSRTRTTTAVRAPATSLRPNGSGRSTHPSGARGCRPAGVAGAFCVPLLAPVGPARPGSSGQGLRDVVIGVSPAVGRDVWRCLSGLAVTDVLREMLAGLEEEGCTGRVVRFNDSVDLGRIGLAAARLAGSGIGIALQGKGTALIHRRDLAPLANLELYSVAPRSPWSCTGCSAPTPRGTPRAARPTRPGTRTPTRPSRPATTPP